MESGETNLLRRLIAQRQWTYQAFALQYTRAAGELARRDAEPRLARLTVSEKTFRRWTGGALRTRPGPDVCRVLEALFEQPAVALFAPAEPPTRSDPDPDSASQSQVKEHIRMATHNAIRYTAMLSDGVSAEAVEVLTAEVGRLALVYSTVPLHELLGDLANVQEIAFRLLETRHRPERERDLHFVAALSSGMLAKASHDQGDPNSAMTLARAAYLAADRAGHEGLKAWVRGIQALTAYWAGWESQSLATARQAQELPGLSGTVTAWLPALEARAAARIGDRSAARSALARAETARDVVTPSDLDGFGGLLTFPTSQQTYYRAETLVLSEPAASQSLTAADEAVTAYSDPTRPDWAFGDEAGSRAHQAMARIAIGELDGGLEALEPVLALPPGQRIHGVTVCARRTVAALPPAGPSTSRTADMIRDAVEEFDRATLKTLPR